MEERKIRKRIQQGIPSTAQKAIVDEGEFIQNLSSHKAKLISTFNVNVSFSIWIDKHYHDRVNIGDEFGKRLGIEKDKIEKIIIDCLKHLLLFGSTIKGFVFLNSKLDQQTFSRRLVIRSKTHDSTLNIAIAVYFIDVSHYEVTIKTAMVVDDFKLFDNEYVIDYEDGYVILSKFDQKKLTEICRF
jgi:hypothetical protein